MARLILKRPSKWLDLARSYKIYVDGQRIGKIHNDETKEFEITPGQHTIKAKIDFLSSKSLRFEVKNDEENLKMLVKNNTKIWLFIIIAFVSMSLSVSIYKSFFPNASFMQFVIFLIIYILSIVLFAFFKPYLKIELVEDLS